MTRPHILAADDDPHIREVLAFALEKAEMRVSLAADGRRAIEAFAAHGADAIILDVGMPELDGIDVCREIRKASNVPILFLSARDDEIDRILGLEMGADDYVTKPFSPRELVARIKNVLRRARPAPIAAEDDKALTAGDLSLVPAHHEACFAGRELGLTALEFRILETLARAPQRVFSRDTLLDRAWPPNIHVSDRTIDSHIRNLRAKLTAAGCASAIVTVHGVGFRLGACKA
jgi:two-component system OmpR family response regulator